MGEEEKINRIIKKTMIVPNVHEMQIYNPAIAKKAEPGQFVILMADERSERIPFTICDGDRETGVVTVVFLEVGASTRKIAMKKEGDIFPVFVGPLGKPAEISGEGTALCIGGCYGIAGIYPYAKALKKQGNTVITMIEGRSAHSLFWEDKLKDVSDEFICVTRDGSRNPKGDMNITGHVPEGIKSTVENRSVDRIYSMGCTFMMMLVSQTTKPYNIKTWVNLNPIMLDGTGMCGVCRVLVDGKTKFACVDGPDFDGHQVDWDMLIIRRKAYLKEEWDSLKTYECKEDF
jgi:ferredoxin--NADP+ reductase